MFPNTKTIIRIVCINKDSGHHNDPHEAITHFGWVNGGGLLPALAVNSKKTLAEMIKYLEEGNSAYVQGPNSQASLVVRVSRYGNKYVKTIANGRETDNLLQLPECRL